jgi:three-Cys-motif partner protein
MDDYEHVDPDQLTGETAGEAEDTSSPFFMTKRAAAVLKHGVLSRYMVPFVSKTGSRVAGGRVAYLDGYAGEGNYEDGTLGSPLLMVQTARTKLAPIGRTLEMHFVEQKRAHYRRLRAALKAEGAEAIWTTYHGKVERHLDAVLAAAEGVPLFAFLDPYGLGLDFEDLVDKVFGRPKYRYAPATEVLLNFSAVAVWRVNGLLRSDKRPKSREGTLKRMDRVCGGDWWRQVSARCADEGADLVAEISTQYRNLLIEATGCAGWIIPVQKKENRKPVYSLVHLSRHTDGLMLFGEAVSGAMVDWRRAIIEPGSLFDDDAAFKAAEKHLDAEYTQELKENVRQLVRTTPRFRIRDKYSEVMGQRIGDARMTHLRPALKQLHQEGLLSSEGKGSPLWDQEVRRA